MICGDGVPEVRISWRPQIVTMKRQRSTCGIDSTLRFQPDFKRFLVV
jgi:hypothetical protein|tara:strand:+ start:138 stop:278 length:141 start_codon:yes stop_codon:yes gene_type:complete